MNKTTDTTINVTDIFRAESNIGSATIYNLRTGEKTTVPWGTLDWVAAIVGGVVTTAILSGVGLFLYRISSKLI